MRACELSCSWGVSASVSSKYCCQSGTRSSNGRARTSASSSPRRRARALDHDQSATEWHSPSLAGGLSTLSPLVRRRNDGKTSESRSDSGADLVFNKTLYETAVSDRLVDRQSPLPCGSNPWWPRRAGLDLRRHHRQQAFHGFVSPGDHDLLAGLGTAGQRRELGLGFVDVHSCLRIGMPRSQVDSVGLTTWSPRSAA